MTEPPATRRELDQLTARLDGIDAHGTRGIAPLAVQLTEVIKDLAELKHDVESRFNAHARAHEKDEAKRVSARRWTVATVVAAVAAVDGPLVTLLLARH